MTQRNGLRGAKEIGGIHVDTGRAQAVGNGAAAGGEEQRAAASGGVAAVRRGEHPLPGAAAFGRGAEHGHPDRAGLPLPVAGAGPCGGRGRGGRQRRAARRPGAGHAQFGVLSCAGAAPVRAGEHAHARRLQAGPAAHRHPSGRPCEDGREGTVAGRKPHRHRAPGPFRGGLQPAPAQRGRHRNAADGGGAGQGGDGAAGCGGRAGNSGPGGLFERLRGRHPGRRHAAGAHPGRTGAARHVPHPHPGPHRGGHPGGRRGQRRGAGSNCWAAPGSRWLPPWRSSAGQAAPPSTAGTR